MSDLPAYLIRYQKQYGLMGLSAAVFRGDSLLFAQGTGLAQKNPDLPVTNQTVFLAASLSKTLVAVAVMQLVEQRKLNLDADINQYLDFRLTNPKRPAAVITCRHLMTHTSGLADTYYDELVAQDPFQFYFDKTDPPLSLQAIVQAFFRPTGRYYAINSFMDVVPGSQDAYSYSNVATTLLAYVVERAAGQPFAQLTKTTIFEPLGMTRTSWQIGSFSPGEMAWQFRNDGTAYGNYTLGLWPAGGLRTTPTDLSRFMRAVALGGSLDGKRILTQASVTQMLTPTLDLGDGAALGLSWAKIQAGPYHNLRGFIGQSEGVNSQMFFDPTTQVGAVVLVNQDYAEANDASTLLNVITDLLDSVQKAR